MQKSRISQHSAALGFPKGSLLQNSGVYLRRESAAQDRGHKDFQSCRPADDLRLCAGFHGRPERPGTGCRIDGRLMLTVLGDPAAFERELIRTRTGEGRERAKARGVKMGRKAKLTAHQQREAIQRRENGEATREIARTYNVSHSTISRLAA